MTKSPLFTKPEYIYMRALPISIWLETGYESGPLKQPIIKVFNFIFISILGGNISAAFNVFSMVIAAQNG